MANVRSGKIFIAYKGTEFSSSSIESALNSFCPGDFVVKTESGSNYVFSKIIYSTYIGDRDPWCYNGIAVVSGYIQEEFESVMGAYRYGIDDVDQKHRLIWYLYRDYSNSVFSKLEEKKLHCCSVIYDKNKDSLIAGVTEPNGLYTHLYYGYTPNNNELMFSNSKEVLENFCNDVIEMDNNTCMKDGVLYNLAGIQIEQKEKNNELIPKNKKNTDAFFDGLNDLLVQIADKAIREKIENNVEEYLNSEDPKKRIEDYILNELDAETQKKILEIIKKAVDDYSVENNIRNTLNETFNEILEEYSKNVNIPVVHIVKLNNTVLGQTKGGFYHEKFDQILTQTQLDEPIMLIGPAGSGKNVAVSQVSEALGLKMYYTNNASNEFKLTGFIDAGGNYRETEFYKAFKNGGVFFLDEIDNSDPSALIVINSALANGYMAFPHETIDRHKDFRMVAAANTWGKGADLQYVGRNALDAATLDRFDNIFFDYDKKLEQALYPKEDVLKFMWAFREAVCKSKIPHVVSTRGIGKVYKKDINGISVEDILTSNVIKNLGQDDVNAIIGNMSDVSQNNKYFKGIKSLRLSR